MTASIAPVERHENEDAASQARALAAWVARELADAIGLRGRALLAVSGGRSPLALFEALGAQALDWAHVTVLLVDERVVPPDHADSNARLVRGHLLKGPAARATFVPPFETLTEPAAWTDQALAALARQANDRLAAMPWPIDVTILGMGEDGHTASLFAGAQGLQGAVTPVPSAGAAGAAASPVPMAWTRPPQAPHPRLTLTLPALLAARRLVLPLQGVAKRAVFEQACLARDPRLPISWLLHDAPQPVQVWLAP